VLRERLAAAEAQAAREAAAAEQALRARLVAEVGYDS
jgi:hypothetical protein